MGRAAPDGLYGVVIEFTSHDRFLVSRSREESPTRNSESINGVCAICQTDSKNNRGFYLTSVQSDKRIGRNKVIVVHILFEISALKL